MGNHAAAPIVKRYLAAVRLEQSTTATLPKRTTPLFRNKLSKVSRHIAYKLCNPHISIVQRYILQRDLAFFNLLANTGDRAGDLDALLVDQICMLLDKEGVMLNITKGKITNMCDPRVVIVLRSSSSEFCPVQELEKYINYCSDNGLDLASGYVFRPLDGHSKLSMKSFTSSAANVRSKLYLKNLNLWDGETSHSTRSGCVLTLSWLGLDKEKIKQHVGWKSDFMFQHYTAGKAMCDKFTSAKVL